MLLHAWCMQRVTDPLTNLPPEPATVEDAVMTAMVRVGKELKQRLPGDRLEFTSIPLLKTVEHHGPLRVSVLADLLHLDASTVSRHVSGLEERGQLCALGVSPMQHVENVARIPAL